MIIIILSLHAYIRAFNHLSSFRHIMHCYHVHLKNEISCHISDLSYIATTFTSWNGAYSMGQISWLFIKHPYFALVIIISSVWIYWDSNSISYTYKGVLGINRWDLNPIYYHPFLFQINYFFLKSNNNYIIGSKRQII